MANGVGKHKLLVIGPTEPWSVREKLCLATSVMTSGDQNWVSVSRAIKPFAEPGRPPDWFSQKHCASQYSELLEATESPKRKRGEKGEVVDTVEDVIVRRLTTDRIEELKRLIRETQEKHRKLKREAELIQAGHLDSKLEEIWHEIQQKKKLEEEEAEVRRRSTDAAFRARQVAKNTHKRVCGADMNSPSGCSSPNQDLSPGDPLDHLTLDFTATKNAPASLRSMTFSESPGLGADDLFVNGSPLDDPGQKKVLCQRSTPPPSPLLSELLKKGSLLASKSRTIGDGDLSACGMMGAADLALTSPPLPRVTAGAPMLSRLLEAGPSQFSAPLSFMAGTDLTSAPVTSTPPLPVDATCAASTGLGEDDDGVPYMGDELDLKTVGDIIAIIEDKADDAAEALDAAAVEAALSLCEDNGHALSGAWDTGPFQGPHPSVPAVVPRSSSSLLCGLEKQTEELHAQDHAQDHVQDHAQASLSSLCSGQGHCPTAFPLEVHAGTAAPHGESVRRSEESGPSEPTTDCGPEKWGDQNLSYGGDLTFENGRLTVRHLREGAPENGINVGQRDVDSGARGDEEVNGAEEDDGDAAEGFLSEPDGEMEPAASESEDGCSLHTASSSLQLLTTADSSPSSPAPCRSSMCSEDLEAQQAHKIWKKSIMLVWRAAANHRYANVFLQPVTDEIAPGYHSIVHRPMDLATIKKNIESGFLRTTAEFQRDIMLMFQNAVMYNSLDHDVYHMAVEMQRDVLEQIQQFLATQLIMETAESGISAKSLRGRDSTRKQESTDKDSVSMSSPAFLLSLFDGGTRGRRCAIEADLKMKK
ncbi:bromodomain-containing protein 8-like [Cynoglossus semilaevis]|nr:bromodomain-containing protein 8-like [Cynoglossus semilaevis]